MGESFNIFNYLRVVPSEMIAVLISTLIIVIIAKKFFWNNVIEYVNARKDVIENEINEAKIKNQQADEYRDEYQRRLKEAKDNAKEIIQNAEMSGRKLEDEIVSRAKNEAEIMLVKASEEIELEKTKARKGIKKEIIDVAFLAAEKIVEKEIDKDKHKSLVEEFIQEVGR